jgi:gamma-glutamylcyclotransferase (GGCT)/AIG2-like uncharacterized protein YtfP
MKNQDCNLIFVYGTLREDPSYEFSHFLAPNASPVGEAVVRGRLFDLGSYPGMALSDTPGELVRGELYEIDRNRLQAVLPLLDEYEGCGPSDATPHEYRRELVEVRTHTGATVKAWAYVLNRPTDDLEPIDSGDYVEWRASNRSASLA